VRTDLIVDGHDRELGFRLPVEGEVEVAREDLPSRAVIPRRGSMRRPIGYFCPDGACAFESLGLGLLAS
jgi:hypothetical protein